MIIFSTVVQIIMFSKLMHPFVLAFFLKIFDVKFDEKCNKYTFIPSHT